jgi:predicted nucleotidyltransferase
LLELFQVKDFGLEDLSICFFLDLGVYLVGSSANGFATEDTDADICIVISSYPVNY